MEWPRNINRLQNIVSLGWYFEIVSERLVYSRTYEVCELYWFLFETCNRKLCSKRKRQTEREREREKQTDRDRYRELLFSYLLITSSRRLSEEPTERTR